jgi:UDP-2,4-diacetamido-2,4,6-trideoxy-beta-L-altropyranose hydrolase
MRCLALANACRDAGLGTCFVGRIEDEILREHIKQCGHAFTALDARLASSWLDSIGRSIDWVILDGYIFNSQDHRNIRDFGARLLVIDDMADLDIYEADIVLNQNFDADAADYHLAHGTTMLMNTRFALLRQEFIGRRPEVRRTPAHRLMVTLGGSDPKGVSLLVVEALSKIHDMRFEVCLIAGSSNPHLDRLKAEVELVRPVGHEIDVLHYANDMPSVMNWADFAVIAGGSTSLEVAYMGLPALVLTLADNQAANAEAMQASGAAESLGWYVTLTADALAIALKRLAIDVPRRQEMTARGQALVDGFGAKRVVETILEQLR